MKDMYILQFDSRNAPHYYMHEQHCHVFCPLQHTNYRVIQILCVRTTDYHCSDTLPREMNPWIWRQGLYGYPIPRLNACYLWCWITDCDE